LDGNSSTLRCPSCGQPIILQASKAEQTLLDKIKNAINNWIEDVEITEENGSLVIVPKGYLGKGLWYEINEALKTFDAEWVSAGRESRWIIKS